MVHELDKYKKDFPEHGIFNWKVVRLTATPGNKLTGVLLHDGNFIAIADDVFLTPDKFEITSEPPFPVSLFTLTKEQEKWIVSTTNQ